MEDEFAGMDNDMFTDASTVADVGKEFIKLVTKQRELKRELDFLTHQKEEKQAELLNIMQDQQIDRISVAGKTLAPSTRWTTSMPKETKEKSFEWLRENGYGELIKEGVHAGTLASTFKEIVKDGEQYPTDLFRVNEVITVSMRKA